MTDFALAHQPALRGADGSAPITTGSVVTGSGSGIGKAIAKRLAGPDTAILLHARENHAGCERVLAEVRAQVTVKAPLS